MNTQANIPTAQEQATVIPNGYMENAQGALVPISSIKEFDLARDEVVKEVAKIALETREVLRLAKEKMNSTVNTLIDLSGERYDVRKPGGIKGNATLISFDGQFKVVRQVSDNLTFDEGLLAAEVLIDECLTDWTQDSNDNIRAVVNRAFRVNKEGKLNMGAILGLRRLDIKDEKWNRAMDAISDSLKVIETRSYLRVYKRNSNGGYDPISLDIAAL